MQATHHPKLPREIPIMYKEWGMQQVPRLGRTHSLFSATLYFLGAVPAEFLLDQDPEHRGSKHIEN